MSFVNSLVDVAQMFDETEIRNIMLNNLPLITFLYLIFYERMFMFDNILMGGDFQVAKSKVFMCV